MARRRGNANGITTVYWRDIPAQVTVNANGVTEKAMLEPRFQHAIDRAAAVANLTEAEAYIAQWRKVTTPLEDNPNGDPERYAAGLADKTTTTLQAEYPRERLEQLVADGGAETA